MSYKNSKSFLSFSKSPYKSIKHTTYFQIYDELFSPFIGEEITFVEIGVLGGGSLFMWRDFFGEKARIIGVDLNPEVKRWEKEGFEIYIGSQSDPEFWNNFLDKVGHIDIILDDGGHTFEQQIITVESALPSINDGGLIVIEDTYTSFMKEFGSPSKFSFINYSKNIIDGINYRSGKLLEKIAEKNIFSLSFYESIVVFKINRDLSSEPSHGIGNVGEEVSVKNYRYSDSKTISLLDKMQDKYNFLKKSKLIKSFFSKIYLEVRKIITFFVNSRKNYSLRKYFRY